MNEAFKVYKSSAGSGKTFTLIKEYLKICLSTSDPFLFSSILAITFTNKATYEMKERLISSLKELSLAGKESTLKHILMEELNIDNSTLETRSKNVLTSILHNFADLNISTIDRFTYRLLRTFGKDLNIPINFQVEIDEKELLTKAIQMMIEQVGKEEHITQLLLHFVQFKIDEEKSWKLEEELVHFSGGLLKEQAIPFLNELRDSSNEDFKTTTAIYNDLNHQFQENVHSKAKEGIELIAKEGIEDVSFAGGRSGISSYFKGLFKKTPYEAGPQLLGYVSKENWTSAKCSPDQKAAILLISDELKAIFEAIQEMLNTELGQYLARKEILKSIHHLSLINQIEKRFSELKKKEQLLSISDFNKLISNVVLSEPMPFIYERLGERFKHIMIDEFQDTSVLQFLNLLPLIEESLSKGHENLIVGDAKQAIYRFRGGEVDQFVDMPDYLPKQLGHDNLSLQRMHSLKSHYHQIILESNYRSAAAIVNFNNQFFEFVKHNSPNEKLKHIYENHHQKVVNKETDGYVEVRFYSGNSNELKQQYAEQCHQHILSLKEDGYDWKDIAILCRKKNQASFIADYLKEKSIGVISPEALLLKNHEPVRFIINLLKWLYMPPDDVVIKRLLHFIYHQGWTNYNSINLLLNAVFIDKKPLNHLFDEMGLHHNIHILKHEPILELVEGLIRIFSFERSYNLYLQFLQDAILEFSQTKGNDALAFLNWWAENENKLSLDIPESLDAVSIMTIHKSKGLEFPIVIYPFADDGIDYSGPRKKNFLWAETMQEPEVPLPYALVEFNKTLEQSVLSNYYDEEYTWQEIDLVNQTYVAFTRAVDRLYIMTKTIKNSATLSVPAMLKQYCEQPEITKVDENHFCVGIKENSRESVKIESTETFQLNYISQAWHDKLQISQPDSLNENDAQSHGIIIHQILSQIKSKKDLEHVLEQFVLKGFISSNQKPELLDEVKGLIEKQEVAHFFQEEYKSKREAALIGKEGKILRPDRVVYFENELAVIDFKTGQFSDEHKDQINEYKAALMEISELPVNAYLLYTQNVELIEV